MPKTLTHEEAGNIGVTGPLTQQELQAIDRYWRAANYLSVGQIYLRDNPLLREPLKLEHTKPRLLGHFGTTPGLNFIYAHMAVPGSSPILILKAPIPSFTPGLPRMPPACSVCSCSFPGPTEFPATLRPILRAPSTKAVNWDTRCCMPMARPLIILTCWFAVLSATAKLKPARWPQAGTPTNS
jgi:hypothetical protein